MKIDYDKKADAMYIKLGTGAVSHTIKLRDKLLVDVDEKENVIGIELIAASTQVALKSFGQISLNLPVFA